jgi:hypothetical protein
MEAIEALKEMMLDYAMTPLGESEPFDCHIPDPLRPGYSLGDVERLSIKLDICHRHIYSIEPISARVRAGIPIQEQLCLYAADVDNFYTAIETFPQKGLLPDYFAGFGEDSFPSKIPELDDYFFSLIMTQEWMTVIREIGAQTILRNVIKGSNIRPNDARILRANMSQLLAVPGPGDDAPKYGIIARHFCQL